THPFTTPPSISLVSYFPNTVSFETSTDEESILFLSDTYAPGWIAYVDGVPTQILRAQYAFRAVVVPKGNHTIVFSYEPLSFTLGKWISIASLFAVLAISTYVISKKKYSHPTLR
ncbi:YfhO family protein, partial [Candidatus Gottesmanbacteria bacterium]|nr:YfhO family protein [Candidatus Gottesmanbacteria bacterium]